MKINIEFNKNFNPYSFFFSLTVIFLFIFMISMCISLYISLLPPENFFTGLFTQKYIFLKQAYIFEKRKADAAIRLPYLILYHENIMKAFFTISKLDQDVYSVLLSDSLNMSKSTYSRLNYLPKRIMADNNTTKLGFFATLVEQKAAKLATQSIPLSKVSNFKSNAAVHLIDPNLIIKPLNPAPTSSIKLDYGIMYEKHKVTQVPLVSKVQKIDYLLIDNFELDKKYVKLKDIRGDWRPYSKSELLFIFENIMEMRRGLDPLKINNILKTLQHSKNMDLYDLSIKYANQSMLSEYIHLNNRYNLACAQLFECKKNINSIDNQIMFMDFMLNFWFVFFSFGLVGLTIGGVGLLASYAPLAYYIVPV